MKKRVDQLLVERGLAETRSHAQALVLAGRVRGYDKPGQQVSEDVEKLPGASLHVWYEHGAQSTLPVDVHAGIMNLDDVKLPEEAGYYLCGPLPFMQGIRSGGAQVVAAGYIPQDALVEALDALD